MQERALSWIAVVVAVLLLANWRPLPSPINWNCVQIHVTKQLYQSSHSYCKALQCHSYYYDRKLKMCVQCLKKLVLLLSIIHISVQKSCMLIHAAQIIKSSV